jgi:Uma2 family endonuclease
MTVDTIPLVPPRRGEPWTVDDLDQLPPDNGMKYEILDGSLVVSPRSNTYHDGVAAEICYIFASQGPRSCLASMEAGVKVRDGTTYLVPDAILAARSAYKNRDTDYLSPSDVLIVVEVLSMSNRGHDLVTKRHYYAVAGIPQYWIADPDERTLTVLALDKETYVQRAVLKPGDVWHTEDPFPLTIEPAEIFG